MPSSPSVTQLACRVTRVASASGIVGRYPVLRDGGNAHDEARAQNGPLATLRRLAIAVLGPDAALMGLHDLARDRKPQARILAKGAFGTVSVETLENALEIFRRNPRPLIFDA